MWVRLDDRMHSHRKSRAVYKSHPSKRRDCHPMGLWAMAASWAGQNGTTGWIAVDELDRFDDEWPVLADRLLAAGYWWEVDRDGEPGYSFNDWHDYNDPADAASKAGSYGNHVRWHENKGRVEVGCEHCPDVGPDVAPESPPMSGGEIAPDRPPIAHPIALPDPNPTRTRPEPEPTTSSSEADASDAEPPRADVIRLCDHLADAIEANGSKRPRSDTKAWQDSARLLLDRDGRTEAQVMTAIDWCQTGESKRARFWRPNVMSMPKLREKYDQMRLQAEQERAENRAPSRVSEHLALVEELRRDEQGLPAIGDRR